MGVAGKVAVLFCNMLGSATDLNVWSGAVVGTAQRISALAVEVVVTAAAVVAAARVVATPSTALVLLSWPHLSFTNSLVFADKGPRGLPVIMPEQDFACRAQVDQGGLPHSKSNYLIHAPGIAQPSQLPERSRIKG
jgi:hypothetical protein